MKTGVKLVDRFLQDCIEEVKSNLVVRIIRGRRQLHSYELRNSCCSTNMWLIIYKKEQMGNVCSTHTIAEDAGYFGDLGVS